MIGPDGIQQLALHAEAGDDTHTRSVSHGEVMVTEVPEESNSPTTMHKFKYNVAVNYYFFYTKALTPYPRVA